VGRRGKTLIRTDGEINCSFDICSKIFKEIYKGEWSLTSCKRSFQKTAETQKLGEALSSVKIQKHKGR